MMLCLSLADMRMLEQLVTVLLVTLAQEVVVKAKSMIFQTQPILPLLAVLMLAVQIYSEVNTSQANIFISEKVPTPVPATVQQKLVVNSKSMIFQTLQVLSLSAALTTAAHLLIVWEFLSLADISIWPEPERLELVLL